MKHCCIRKHYFFVVKKCGSELCQPPRLPNDTLKDYMPFLTQCQEWKGITKVSMTSMEVLLMNLIFLLSRNNQKRKILLFASSLRHVKNIDMMLQCEQCGSWRLPHCCEQKLTKKERENPEEGLADVLFTCGAPLQDLYSYQGDWQMFMLETFHVRNPLRNPLNDFTTQPSTR